jgi:hypothetical protein
MGDDDASFTVIGMDKKASISKFFAVIRLLSSDFLIMISSIFIEFFNVVLSSK